jgi:hypothetical protein
MADTFTAIHNMTKPEPGASDDTWGEKLNTNLDTIDAALDRLLTSQMPCRFEYVNGTTCRLNRFGGEYLFINGSWEEIPSAGVDLVTASLASNDTRYYVYAYMSGATMTLEASATAPATDST